MERAGEHRVYTGFDTVLLKRFRTILPDLLRDDLEPFQMQEVMQRHNKIIGACIDHGLTMDICKIRDEYETEQKLKKLKTSYESGEIEQ